MRYRICGRNEDGTQYLTMYRGPRDVYAWAGDSMEGQTFKMTEATAVVEQVRARETGEGKMYQVRMYPVKKGSRQIRKVRRQNYLNYIRKADEEFEMMMIRTYGRI